MSISRTMPQLRLTIVAAAVALAVGAANAQTPSSHDSFNDNPVAATESSSSAVHFNDDGLAAVPAAPSPANGAAAGGQNGGGQSGHWYSFSRLAGEAGGGFNAPTGDSSPYITWGGNFSIGAGPRFSPHLAALVEYQFVDDKLPGALIAETGANGGDAHIWSLTLDPVIDVAPKRKNDLYITGGGGFYRKVTNFTDPSNYCDFFECYTQNVVVGHFSSNQGGWNVGGGFIHRLGGTYGDSKAQLFAEARYLDVMTPAVVHLEPNGLSATSVGADTKLVPVTFGVRW